MITRHSKGVDNHGYELNVDDVARRAPIAVVRHVPRTGAVMTTALIFIAFAVAAVTAFAVAGWLDHRQDETWTAGRDTDEDRYRLGGASSGCAGYGGCGGCGCGG
jgi:hypothetical protein